MYILKRDMLPNCVSKKIDKLFEKICRYRASPADIEKSAMEEDEAGKYK